MTVNRILFEETQVDTKNKKNKKNKNKMLNAEMEKDSAFLKNYLEYIEDFPGEIT